MEINPSTGAKRQQLWPAEVFKPALMLRLSLLEGRIHPQGEDGDESDLLPGLFPKYFPLAGLAGAPAWNGPCRVGMVALWV